MHPSSQTLRLLPAPALALFPLLLAALLLVFLGTQPARSQVADQQENSIFGATVTSVETSPGGNGWRYLTATVHLQNLTKQLLVLGVERGKLNSIDDRRNSYAVTMIRGIGEIATGRVDPRFVLPAGGGGDALVEMRWRGDRNAIFGTTFDLTFPVRVIVPLDAGQYKIGAEYLMTFTGLKAGHIASPKGTVTLSENTVDAGPFTLQIIRLTPSTSGNRRLHTATLMARIKNTSSKPITLAYEGTSSFGVDDQGNRYSYGTAGTHDTSASGIGILTSIKADPQFVLAAGEARDVQFSVVRPLGRDTAGTRLTYYVALAQLEVRPGDQIRTVRQYSLTFPRIPGLN